MIRDPVTGFEYPDAWVNSCETPELLAEVASGLCVLTSSGKILRRGFTTGTTAAAVCKAAILSLERDMSEVSIGLSCGLNVNVPVTARQGVASCKKYSGDYRDDVTSGIEFVAMATPTDGEVVLEAGEGIGRFVRDTPRYPVESPAISDAAMATIMRSITEGLGEAEIDGAVIELSIPGGAEIGRKTLNSRIGVEGGISVLGTTGLVEPWDDHLDEAVHERISRSKKDVITTGRIGLRYSRLLFPDHEAVLAGSGLGKALQYASGEVVICGLPGLILKYMNPLILENRKYGTVEELSASPEWPATLSSELQKYKKENPDIRVVIIDRSGKVMGDSL